MTKFDSRNSKIILILIGVLAALAIGYQSNAVGLGSKIPIKATLIQQSRDVLPVLEKTNLLESKIDAVLLNK